MTSLFPDLRRRAGGPAGLRLVEDVVAPDEEASLIAWASAPLVSWVRDPSDEAAALDQLGARGFLAVLPTYLRARARTGTGT